MNLRYGKDNPSYNGGLSFHKAYGRWVIMCRNGSKVHFARGVMEAHLRRPLLSEEIVHHINGDQTDDRIENLAIVSRADHIRIHHAELTETRSRTTPEIVRQIREAEGTLKQIGQRFGLDWSYVGRIRRGENRKAVK